MSYRSFDLCCSCGHEFTARLWDAINVTEQKTLKSRLLSGEINLIQCKKCGKKSYIEKELLYHDMNQKLWIQMFPQSERSRWHSLEEENLKKIKKSIKFQKYQFRLTFGREELIEKVRIFESCLDDRIIELLKLRVMEEDEQLKSASDLRILFSRYVPEDAEIQLHVLSIEKNLSQTVVISFDHYQEIEEMEEHLKENEKNQSSEICQGMYINIEKTRVLH
ncbi:MAG: CpXC domain-containing protein [Deltaproteobacteria bacterium]|nr:CpXC domain-containing protein [Deltaproteobacteria bacterium]